MSRNPREEVLFAHALAQPPDARGADPAHACGANVDLLAHLVTHLAPHEGEDSLTRAWHHEPASPRWAWRRAQSRRSSDYSRTQYLRRGDDPRNIFNVVRVNAAFSHCREHRAE